MQQVTHLIFDFLHGYGRLVLLERHGTIVTKLYKQWIKLKGINEREGKRERGREREN